MDMEENIAEVEEHKTFHSMMGSEDSARKF